LNQRRTRSVFNLFKKKQPSAEALLTSELYDETTFYKKFLKDLHNCKEEVIIESPFITISRMKTLHYEFELLIRKGINVYVITRDPLEHNKTLALQAEAVIQVFEDLGVQVFFCKGNHHRKLAILDRKVLWEGSLNILSQIKSRENYEKNFKQVYIFTNV
jgi:hypothetical protein